jgi:hypothetical protein
MHTRSIVPALERSRISVCFQVVVLLTLFVSFLGTAYSQSTSGTLTGTITDAQGAAMAGVTVTLHNTDTGVDLKPVLTSDSGLYVVSSLAPGKYDVTASQTGFATVRHPAVEVQVGLATRIDVEMPVASQQSLVTVTTEVPLIETEKTEQSQNVSEALVTNLPVSSRRWEQFVLLTPGVVPDGGAGAISFHGITSAYNNSQVDGANNNNSYNAGARGGTNDGYVYSGDSIREFQVASSGFNAEMGQAAGGQVNAVTKSGTSQFHGDLFYNMRNPIFNAIDPVTAASAISAGQIPTQTVHQQNQFGGSLGAPIWKDKLFFFGTGDIYRKSTPIAYTSTFSATPANLTPDCPVIGADLNAGGTFTAAMCAAAIAYVDSNLGQFPRLLSQDVELAKIDFQLNTANHFSAVTNIRDWKEPNGTAYAASNNSGIFSSATTYIQDRFFILTANTLIGNNKVNEFRYQWGIDNNFTSSYGGVPQVGISSLVTYGQTGPVPGYNAETRNQFTDNFSFTKGAHTFKVGFDANVIYENIRISRGSTGIYSYSQGAASGTYYKLGVAQPGSACPASGTAQLFCDWVLDTYGVKTQGAIPITTTVGGVTTTTSTLENTSSLHWTNFAQIKDNRYPGIDAVGTRAGIDQFNNEDYAAYFQDTWKVRPNLTINAGIRYDIQMVPNFPNPNTSKPILALYTSQLNVDTGGIQPRLAVAWNIKKNTVIRVGGGIFTAKTVTSTFSSARRTSGVREQQFNCTPVQAFNLPACEGPAGISQPLVFPSDLFSQNAPTPSAAFSGPGVVPAQILNPPGDLCASNPTACAVRGIDPADKRPRAYELEAGVEQRLPGNVNFSASYLFTRGVKLPAHYDTNLGAAVTKNYDVQASTGAAFQTVTVPFFDNRLDNSVGVILIEASPVTSRYNAMVLTVRKPMSHGIELLANYTFSGATDDGQTGQNIGGSMFFSSDGVLNPYNFKLEQGRSATDTPHRFVASAVWQPDLAKKASSRFVRGAVNGWSMATTVTASSGSTYSALIQSSAVQCSIVPPTGKSCGQDASSGILGLDGGMTGTILNSNAAPSGGRVAFQPRNSQVLPNYTNVDFRLARSFTLRERFGFEFRAEAFNLLNSTIVTAVNQTGYTFAQPSASTTAAPTPACWNGAITSGAGPTAGTASHTNTCVIPVAGYQAATTTSANLLGARQLQFGFRFTF